MNKNNITIALRLQILGITQEEIQNCSSIPKQKDFVRRAAKLVIKNKNFHPDDPDRTLSNDLAKKNTQEILAARDEILSAIELGKFPIQKDINDIDSAVKMVNNQFLRKAVESFSQESHRTKYVEKEPSKQVSEMTTNFNKGHFTVKDAIASIRKKLERLKTKIKENSHDNQGENR